MLKLLNKLVIPTILLATVMVAGMFAFMPVNQASTVHTSGTAVVAPSSATATETVSYTFAGGGAEDIFHYVFLESAVPFTLIDIEFETTIDAGLNDAGDDASVDTVRAIPAEIPSTFAGITTAVADQIFNFICDKCIYDMIGGEDTTRTATFSFTAFENDNDSGNTGSMSFGPNTKIFVQVGHQTDDTDAGDMVTVVTFYVNGPTASDLTITALEDQATDFG